MSLSLSRNIFFSKNSQRELNLDFEREEEKMFTIESSYSRRSLSSQINKKLMGN